MAKKGCGCKLKKRKAKVGATKEDNSLVLAIGAGLVGFLVIKALTGEKKPGSGDGTNTNTSTNTTTNTNTNTPTNTTQQPPTNQQGSGSSGGSGSQQSQCPTGSYPETISFVFAGQQYTGTRTQAAQAINTQMLQVIGGHCTVVESLKNASDAVLFAIADKYKSLYGKLSLALQNANFGWFTSCSWETANYAQTLINKLMPCNL